MSIVNFTMKILVVLAAILLVAQCYSYLDANIQQWEDFKLKYGKKYSSDIEEEYRMEIFMDKLQYIKSHNEKYELGLVSYNLTMNKFGDMETYEVTSTYTGLYTSTMSHREYDNKNIITFPENGELPSSVDWRKKGAVTPVKDQGNCGSCWAFSTTGSVEGQHFIKTKNLVSLSEQNLIDCTSNNQYGNYGCDGGWMNESFIYIKDNGGIDTETSYKYEARNSKCRFKPDKVGATVSGYVDIEKGNEKQLQVAAANIGPVSVAIDATHMSFHHYHHGVYDEPDCDPICLTHAVLVVGYGTENGKDYWLVKNSWAASWGDQGYIKMSRNKDNQCGIATMASYPTV